MSILDQQYLYSAVQQKHESANIIITRVSKHVYLQYKNSAIV